MTKVDKTLLHIDFDKFTSFLFLNPQFKNDGIEQNDATGNRESDQ